MPTRILREGILTSEAVNALSESAELFYRRLMSVADDYGRYYAHPSIVRAACYPLRLDKQIIGGKDVSVSESDVKRFLSECEAVGLLTIYNGLKHLVIHNFRQQTRAKSRFPEPTKDELLSKGKTNVHLVGGVVVVGGEGGDAVGASARDASTPTLEEVQTFASMQAIKPETAKAFFDHYEGKNLWLNRFGRLINWKHELKVWAERDRQPKHGQSATSTKPLTRWQINSEIEIIQKRIDELKKKDGMHYDGQHWSGKMKEETKATVSKLRGDIENLKAQIDKATE